MTQNKTEDPNDVDSFIRRLRDGEIAIHPNAQEITIQYGISNYEKLAQGLTDAINDYQNYGQSYYQKCKNWINFAYTYSVVITGASVKQVMNWKDNKIATLEQRILDLEREYDALNETYKKIIDENISLKALHQECSDKFDKLVNAFSGQGKIDR